MTFKELLEKHGYNLSSLAVALSLNKATPSYWVKVKKIGKREKIEKVSALLNESIETISASLKNS